MCVCVCADKVCVCVSCYLSFFPSMVTDHCTLLLADSALSHAPLAAGPAFNLMDHGNNSQADSDINMPLDHLTPSSAPLTPNSAPLTPTSPSRQDHTRAAANGSYGNSNHDNIIITPTPLDVPKK